MIIHGTIRGWHVNLKGITTLEAALKDNTGIPRIGVIDPFKDALPCWSRRNYRKEMFACLIGAFNNGPHAVLVTVNEGEDGHNQESRTTTFRCKPSADGGVILFKGKRRKQYHHMTLEEWVEWAGKYGI